MNEQLTRTMQDGSKVPFPQRIAPEWQVHKGTRGVEALLRYNIRRKEEVARGEFRQARLGVLNQSNEDDLYADCDPRRLLKREKPWHRTAINMAAAGYTDAEIGRFTGRSPHAIENVLRQPFARDYLKKEAKKTVQDEIKQLLEQQVKPSIEALVAVRDSQSSKGSDVIAASKELLDRSLGKSTQTVALTKSPSDMTDEELKAAVLAEMDGNKAN